MRSQARARSSRSPAVRSTASSSPIRTRSWRAATAPSASTTASVTTTRPPQRCAPSAALRSRSTPCSPVARRSISARAASCRCSTCRATRPATSRCTTREPVRSSAATALQGSVYLGLDGSRKLCPTYTDVDPYLETIDLVEALAPGELHGCHWPAARGPQVQAFLDESRAYVMHVDGLAEDCFAAAPDGLTLRELIVCVNERLDEPWDAALAQELVTACTDTLSGSLRTQDETPTVTSSIARGRAREDHANRHAPPRRVPEPRPRARAHG